jgi:endo-1,4-beta-xylanase
VWARKYGGEGVKLVYNQNNNTLYGQPQSEACIELHTALRHAGIPIDGIGIQLHTHITKEGVHQLSANDIERPEFDTELFAKNLKAMADSGIDVYITECDVHLYGEHNDAMLKKQADAYVAMLQPCLEASNCKSFKTWGLFDGSCWKPLNKNNPELVYEPYPLLFDHELNPKPAYYELKDMMIELIENNAGQNKR